ncbi:flagellar hook-length control protein FliK [Sphingomonas sp. R-74633]|uniref:flagellar hook-length control protein FliK n=1 Tax=Sphingomonas sp. R-74633 TaxID=2751188 RepID=UPI0015D114D7|nr:flagellar hook-length control protein FliK [Sphingomonas sp. R-74633]NYT42117.1 flagellar hook-length control protein FliK [Sphingomonas sp. R-74633]
MQINNLGFAGLLGAGSANTAAAATGDSLGQAFGLLLGAPNTPAGAGMTPPLAANDASAPAVPAATPNLSMAQLLTTAAPLATPAVTPAGVTPAVAAPIVTEPDAQPIVADPAAAAPTLPEDPAMVPQAQGEPIVQGKPAKPAPDAKPNAGLDLLADPAPEAPVAEAPVEQPFEEPKTPTPVKRGPRLADDVAEELPADPAVSANAQPVPAEIVAAAVAQAPVRPELAVKPQPSPTRQIGEVSSNARKAEAGRAEPASTQPAAGGEKAHAAVSAVAGKAGDKNDNAASDERGQAPAFTLRPDAHAAPAHATTETSRTPATASIAVAEPVIAARPGHLGQQMGVEIARKVEAGDDTLRVRLSPDNLGKVEVTLSFDDAGTLRATVRADSAHALDMLRQDAPDLGRALDQAGIRADAQSFRFESRSEGGGAQGQQQQSQNSAGNHFAGNDEPDVTEAYREIRGDGQVDLLA